MLDKPQHNTALDDLVGRYIDSGKAPSTSRLYGVAYRDFQSWCRAAGLALESVDEHAIARYLADLAGRLRVATIGSYLAGVLRSLERDGVLIDGRHPVVRDTLRGIRVTHDRDQRKAAALSVSDVRGLVATCDDSLICVRDRALILTGFSAAFRRSELVAVDAEHLLWKRDGVEIFVPRSKEDQGGVGETVYIPMGHNPVTCPVSALQTWLQRSGITCGPIFRSITKGGHLKETRLIDKQVSRILVARAALAGIKAPAGRAISSHSLRAGFITEAHRAGVVDEAIMKHTRHRTPATMRGYVRRENLDSENPAARIGL